ncbi:LemA family protein [Candidatus Nomurabacteria bacterium]|uniref:LemA family protein n=1 Tax=Candidatus Dojkabacteria bacterium TaxID=2099670 RepID=A0A955KXA9_9BACT|nr:LemA family protein [Candidatus Dojkabacteria bacterium]MCB9790262.1 LemA family protein [Candidatus Nomurabacteria bacterium]MCB9803217.1 LemA family protein [Candidatus Nomurabacteria bacterium]
MKKTLFIALLGIVGVLVLVGGYLVGKYNTMVDLDLDAEKAQGQVEVVLQRRFDLIPNLVESVRGAMDQEEDVFTALAEARTRYAGTSSGTPERVDAANQVESALSRLLVVMENYPELRSVDTVQSLMDELTGTENRISVERQRYNEEVTTYNKFIRRFPNNLLAGMFGFEDRPLFEAVSEADVAPSVDLAD